MQRGAVENFLMSSFVLLIVALILFPLPFTRYMKYDVSGAYISLVLIAFLIPVVFIYSKTYWHNKITIGVSRDIFCPWHKWHGSSKLCRYTWPNFLL